MELGDKFIRDLMQSDLEVMMSLHAKGSTKSEAITKLRTKKTLMESQKIGEQQKMALDRYLFREGRSCLSKTTSMKQKHFFKP